jgi:hypothetical protein
MHSLNQNRYVVFLFHCIFISVDNVNMRSNCVQIIINLYFSRSSIHCQGTRMGGYVLSSEAIDQRSTSV